MVENFNFFFEKKHLNYALTLYTALVTTLLIFFSSKSIEPYWYFFGVLAIFFFFGSLRRYTFSTKNLTPNFFEKKLFALALIPRIIYVLLSYGFFLFMNGDPFEFNSADSKGYHGEALWIVDLWERGELKRYAKYLDGSFSDAGFPVFLSIFNVLGESIIIPRLVNAFLGAKTAVFSYRLATRSLGITTGKLAGLLVAFMPSLIHYCGLHLKETLMIFLVMGFLEKIDFLLRYRTFRIKHLVSVLVLGLSLFFFRTVVGVAALFSLSLAVLLTDKRISSVNRRFKMALSAGTVSLLFIVSIFSSEINYYYENRDTNQTSQMEHFASRVDGNKLARLGSVSVFAPMILIAPFPTLVNTNQTNQLMIHGTLLVKNIIAFFVIFGIYSLWKRKMLKQNILIITFIIAYLAIIASSAFALSERFHLVSVPALLILSAEGIFRYKFYKGRQAYILYFFMLFILIIGWNWFKLAGRS